MSRPFVLVILLVIVIPTSLANSLPGLRPEATVPTRSDPLDPRIESGAGDRDYECDWDSEYEYEYD